MQLKILSREVVIRLDTLKSIRLWRVKAADEGVRSIANYLQGNKTVTILDLMDNGITALGITVLNLGCEFLGKALHPSSNQTLQKLMLDHNSIGTDGLKNLCQGMILVN